MKLIYLSAHYPPNFQEFVFHLRRQGVEVLGVTDQPLFLLPEPLKKALKDHRQVSCLDNTWAVLSAVDSMVEEHGVPDKVESHIETWLELEALIRERYGLNGPNQEHTASFKHKSRMKERFREAKVPVAEGIRIEDSGDISQALRFLRRHSKEEFILKPDCGVGGVGAVHLRSEADFRRLIQAFEGPAFLEVFLQGRIESFDGLVDQAGNIVYCTSHIYSAGVREITSHKLDFTIASQIRMPQDLFHYGKRSLSAFDIREKFFHLEFFRLKNNQLIALEANIRPPGGMLVDMMNWAADMNLYQQWASVVAWNRFTEPGIRNYHTAHISRRAHRPYRYSHLQLKSRFPNEVLDIQQLHPAAAEAMGEWAILVRSPSMSKIAEITQAAHTFQG